MAFSKRIPKEIADAQSDSMKASGIYYWCDETDMRRGKAMIIGPPDTPYEGCPLVFQFQLPSDYPFNPPSVQILTSDGSTRFHPNLYINGKVCLSILGTWSGPKWSAVMNISTVLSSIQSLLDANPITNEPGQEKYTLADTRAANYAAFVRARLIGLSLRDLHRWKKGDMPAAWAEFEDVFKEIGEGLYAKLAAVVQKEAEKEEISYTGLYYSMHGKTEWKRLAELVGAAAPEAKIAGT